MAENMAESGKTPVLDVQELGIDFGGLTAVNDLNLQVFDGEIAGLIGPNGAGHQQGGYRENLPEYPSVRKSVCT